MLDWIDAQAHDMLRLVIDLAGVNSGTANLPGLAHVAQRLEAELAILGGPVERLDLKPCTEIDTRGEPTQTPLAQALRLRIPSVAPGAPRVFLGIHYDTVYPANHPFQHVERIDANTLRGPGVADAKGGIVVMLTAVRAVLRSDLRGRLAFEILLNPDEEIGSPGSTALLREAATRNDVGLVFEPALEGGELAGSRKGSGNFTVVVRGRSAHVGRHPELGRSAIHAAADLVSSLIRSPEHRDGITLNVGKVDGGGPSNVVADTAIVRLNIRAATAEHATEAEALLRRHVDAVNERDGLRAELHGSFTSPPKPLDAPTLALFTQLHDCGRDLGLNIQWRDTGGVCDGNKLAAAGLPTIDTLGPRGGSIHSAQEFLQIDSLTERAKLTALFLARLAGA